MKDERDMMETENMAEPDIKYLFEPRSIAVIGASHNPDKIGYKLLENIVSGGYGGKLFPINPRGGELLGLEVYAGLDAVPGEVDMACIAIPADHIMSSVEACARKGVKFLVITTSGFSEIGKIAEEKRLVQYARENGMRVLGPNIFGIFSASKKLNATFGPSNIVFGNVAIITQSGAIGSAMIGKTISEGIGLSSIVSVGNKSDIDESDLLEYLMDHDGTRIILMYIEGVKNGEKFVSVLKRATQKKPVLVIKTGRSKRGAMAAASHTGSLAGADDVFESIVVKQSGAIRVDTIQEAINWCKFLSTAPVLGGNSSVIITNGGGVGVMAADACEKYGVKLYDDVEDLRRTFSDVVPDFGSTKNPVDLTGQATAADYDRALKAALSNDEIHSVICLGCETALFNAEAVGRVLEENHHLYKDKKPMVISFFGGDSVEKSIGGMSQKGIPVFQDVYEAVSCLGALNAQTRNFNRRAIDDVPGMDMDLETVKDVLRAVRDEGRRFLLPPEAKKVMDAVGLPTPKSQLAKALDEAVNASERIGYPVVMKIASRDIIHKRDVGGVALDLQNKEEVVDAYQAMMFNCKKHKPDARIEGVDIMEMVRTGIEIIIGARRDSSFGPMVMFGLGGTYVEVMKDVSFGALPMDRREVLRIMGEIRSYPLLLGVRGEEKKDIGVVADMILRVGEIIMLFPEITDIEINPVVVYEEGDGARALDVRILLSTKDDIEVK